MKPEEIQITDYMRILLGEVPSSFLIEAAFRIFFVYLILLVSMRLMGKRMASTLSSSELAGLVSLAAAVGVPMLAPDRGMLPPVIIALIVVGVHRIMSYYAYKSSKFENVALGDISVLVEDGIMLLDVMKKNRVTPERLLAEFRNNGISNLGRIRRAYLETTGNFTNLTYNDPRPGLAIIPYWDKDFLEELPKAENTYACTYCGNILHNEKNLQWPCENCNHKQWTQAILT